MISSGMKRILLPVLLTGLLWSQSGVLTSRKAPADVELTADPGSDFWRAVPNVVTDTDYNGNRVANHRMEVRSRWTPNNLYLLFISQYEALNVKPGPSTT